MSDLHPITDVNGAPIYSCARDAPGRCFVARARHMRWTMLIFIIAMTLIIDALNFNGYYRDEAINSLMRGAYVVSG